MALSCSKKTPASGVIQTHITADTTFGSSAVLRGYFSGAGDSIGAAVIKTIPLSSGKILVLASTDSTSLSERISVSRWSADGTTLDATFAAAEPTPGYKVFAIGTDHTTPTDMALQSDGKIIVAGAISDTIGSTPDEGVILRLNADGTLDGTFGTAGYYRDNYTYAWCSISALEIDSADKILFTGWVSSDQTTYKTLVGRLTSAGALDVTFDTDGSRLIDYNVSPNYGADNAPGFSIMVTSLGKILVVSNGWNNTTLENSGILALLTSTGADETSFSGDGYLHIQNNLYYSPIRAALTSADKILLLADTTNAPQTDSYSWVTKYNLDGSVDTSFGTGGYIQTATTGSALIYSGDVLINSDNQIITSNFLHTGVAGNGTIIIQIFSATGKSISSIDSGLNFSFDTNAAFDEFVYSASLDSSGGLLVTGQEQPTGPTVRPGYIARFNLP